MPITEFGSWEEEQRRRREEEARKQREQRNRTAVAVNVEAEQTIRRQSGQQQGVSVFRMDTPSQEVARSQQLASQKQANAKSSTTGLVKYNELARRTGSEEVIAERIQSIRQAWNTYLRPFSGREAIWELANSEYSVEQIREMLKAGNLAMFDPKNGNPREQMPLSESERADLARNEALVARGFYDNPLANIEANITRDNAGSSPLAVVSQLGELVYGAGDMAYNYAKDNPLEAALLLLMFVPVPGVGTASWLAKGAMGVKAANVGAKIVTAAEAGSKAMKVAGVVGKGLSVAKGGAIAMGGYSVTEQKLEEGFQSQLTDKATQAEETMTGYQEKVTDAATLALEGNGETLLEQQGFTSWQEAIDEDVDPTVRAFNIVNLAMLTGDYDHVKNAQLLVQKDIIDPITGEVLFEGYMKDMDATGRWDEDWLLAAMQRSSDIMYANVQTQMSLVNDGWIDDISIDINGDMNSDPRWKQALELANADYINKQLTAEWFPERFAATEMAGIPTSWDQAKNFLNRLNRNGALGWIPAAGLKAIQLFGGTHNGVVAAMELKQRSKRDPRYQEKMGKLQEYVKQNYPQVGVVHQQLPGDVTDPGVRAFEERYKYGINDQATLNAITDELRAKVITAKYQKEMGEALSAEQETLLKDAQLINLIGDVSKEAGRLLSGPDGYFAADWLGLAANTLNLDPIEYTQWRNQNAGKVEAINAVLEVAASFGAASIGTKIRAGAFASRNDDVTTMLANPRFQSEVEAITTLVNKGEGAKAAQRLGVTTDATAAGRELLRMRYGAEDVSATAPKIKSHVDEAWQAALDGDQQKLVSLWPHMDHKLATKRADYLITYAEKLRAKYEAKGTKLEASAERSFAAHTRRVDKEAQRIYDQTYADELANTPKIPTKTVVDEETAVRGAGVKADDYRQQLKAEQTAVAAGQLTPAQQQRLDEFYQIALSEERPRHMVQKTEQTAMGTRSAGKVVDEEAAAKVAKERTDELREQLLQENRQYSQDLTSTVLKSDEAIEQEVKAFYEERLAEERARLTSEQPIRPDTSRADAMAEAQRKSNEHKQKRMAEYQAKTVDAQSYETAPEGIYKTVSAWQKKEQSVFGAVRLEQDKVAAFLAERYHQGDAIFLELENPNLRRTGMAKMALHGITAQISNDFLRRFMSELSLPLARHVGRAADYTLPHFVETIQDYALRVTGDVRLAEAYAQKAVFVETPYQCKALSRALEAEVQARYSTTAVRPSSFNTVIQDYNRQMSEITDAGTKAYFSPAPQSGQALGTYKNQAGEYVQATPGPNYFLTQVQLNPNVYWLPMKTNADKARELMSQQVKQAQAAKRPQPATSVKLSKEQQKALDEQYQTILAEERRRFTTDQVEQTALGSRTMGKVVDEQAAVKAAQARLEVIRQSMAPKPQPVTPAVTESVLAKEASALGVAMKYTQDMVTMARNWGRQALRASSMASVPLRHMAVSLGGVSLFQKKALTNTTMTVLSEPGAVRVHHNAKARKSILEEAGPEAAREVNFSRHVTENTPMNYYYDALRANGWKVVNLTEGSGFIAGVTRLNNLSENANYLRRMVSDQPYIVWAREGGVLGNGREAVKAWLNTEQGRAFLEMAGWKTKATSDLRQAAKGSKTKAVKLTDEQLQEQAVDGFLTNIVDGLYGDMPEHLRDNLIELTNRAQISTRDMRGVILKLAKDFPDENIKLTIPETNTLQHRMRDSLSAFDEVMSLGMQFAAIPDRMNRLATFDAVFVKTYKHLRKENIAPDVAARTASQAAYLRTQQIHFDLMRGLQVEMKYRAFAWFLTDNRMYAQWMMRLASRQPALAGVVDRYTRWNQERNKSLDMPEWKKNDLAIPLGNGGYQMVGWSSMMWLIDSPQLSSLGNLAEMGASKLVHLATNRDMRTTPTPYGTPISRIDEYIRLSWHTWLNQDFQHLVDDYATGDVAKTEASANTWLRGLPEETRSQIEKAARFQAQLAELRKETITPTEALLRAEGSMWAGMGLKLLKSPAMGIYTAEQREINRLNKALEDLPPGEKRLEFLSDPANKVVKLGWGMTGNFIEDQQLVEAMVIFNRIEKETEEKVKELDEQGTLLDQESLRGILNSRDLAIQKLREQYEVFGEFYAVTGAEETHKMFGILFDGAFPTAADTKAYMQKYRGLTDLDEQAAKARFTANYDRLLTQLRMDPNDGKYTVLGQMIKQDEVDIPLVEHLGYDPSGRYGAIARRAARYLARGEDGGKAKEAYFNALDDQGRAAILAQGIRYNKAIKSNPFMATLSDAELDKIGMVRDPQVRKTWYEWAMQQWSLKSWQRDNGVSPTSKAGKAQWQQFTDWSERTAETQPGWGFEYHFSQAPLHERLDMMGVANPGSALSPVWRQFIDLVDDYHTELGQVWNKSTNSYGVSPQAQAAAPVTQKYLAQLAGLAKREQVWWSEFSSTFSISKFGFYWEAPGEYEDFLRWGAKTMPGSEQSQQSEWWEKDEAEYAYWNEWGGE